MKLENKLKAGFAALAMVLPILLSGCNSEKSDAYARFDYDLTEYITLGEYKGIPITASNIEVTQEDIDMQVQALLAQKGESKNIPEDQAIVAGDNIICRCIVTLDGEAIPELYEESSTFILGIGHYGEEIDNALIGTKQGDKVTAKRTLGDMYGEYAGKTVDYELHVLGGYNMALPAYTDAFVKAFYGYETIEKFEAELRNRMLAFRRENQMGYLVTQCWESVMNNVTVLQYPEAELKENVEYYVADAQATAESIGMTYELYLDNVYGMTPEEFEVAIEDQAKADLKSDMAVYAIARAENLTISDERYTQYLGRFIDEYDDFMYPYEVENTFGKEILRSEVLKEVVKEYVVEVANITYSTETEA